MTARISRRRLLSGVAAALPVPALGGCATGAGAGPSRLRMMIPNSAGSGYDQTGRAVARTIEDRDLTGRVEAFSVIGAGGTVGLARLLNERRNGDLMMVMGLGLVGATYAHSSAARVSDATPLVRLIQDSEGVVVRARSPYRSLNDLLAAWRQEPGQVVVGGGSQRGGPDHLFAMELARAAGITPRAVAFRSHDGGGGLLSALLGRRLAFATSGLAELHQQVENGQLRVLATAGRRREPGYRDIPTLREQGIDLTFTNWRGLLAPPGIGRSRQNDLTGLLRRMRGSADWNDVLSARGWTDAWLAQDDFAGFLRAQDRRVRHTMADLDLA